MNSRITRRKFAGSVLGAAAVAAGVVMLVIAHGDEKAGDETVALFPIVGPRGGGAAVEWRF